MMQGGLFLERKKRKNRRKMLVDRSKLTRGGGPQLRADILYLSPGRKAVRRRQSGQAVDRRLQCCAWLYGRLYDRSFFALKHIYLAAAIKHLNSFCPAPSSCEHGTACRSHVKRCPIAHLDLGRRASCCGCIIYSPSSLR